MDLTREELERIAYLPGGDLAVHPFPVLLVAYAALGRSLELRASSGPVTKYITILEGAPVDCQSNLLQDTLARYLLSRGQLREEQASALEAEAAASDRPIEELLAARGWVEAEQLGRSQQQHLARKLLDVFAWEKGSFECGTVPLVPDAPIRVKVPQLLIMGIEKLAPSGQVEAWAAGKRGKPLRLESGPRFSPGELRLGAPQQALVERLRAGVRLEELDPTGEDERARRFVYALALLGMVTDEPAAPALAPASAPAPAPAPVASAPAVPAQAAAPVPPPVIARPGPARGATPERRRELLELFARHRGLDAFDLLGLAPAASAAEVESAFLGHAERTAPWAFEGDEIAARARELFLAGARAFAELSDPERRATLQARRSSPLDQAQDRLRSAREAFRIQTRLLDPRQQFHKGVELLGQKRYAEALEQLQYAVDCDPQNATFRAELARCHWLSQPAARARGSVRDLEEATRLDPECGPAFLYLGEILVSLEKIEEARVALKRAAQLLLPDRRGVDMLNALPPPGRKLKPGGKLGKWF